MMNRFVKLLMVASVAVASVAVQAETKITMNAKSPKEIDSLCDSLGKFGGKVFEQMVSQGNANELIGKAKQMDRDTGLLMLGAAEEAIRHYSEAAAAQNGIRARDVEVQKGLAETAAYIRCHKMIVPKYNR